jgi:hypothetical protein
MTPRTGILAGYLSEEELAAELDKHERTIKRWRKLGIGPPYVERGRDVEYPIEGTRDWLAAGGTRQTRTTKRPRAAATRGRGVPMSVAD